MRLHTRYTILITLFLAGCGNDGAPGAAGTGGSGGVGGSDEMAPCDVAPSDPTDGAFAAGCAGTASGGTCALTCDPGFVATADEAICTNGTWDAPGCDAAPFPFGTNLDADGDGAITYLFGGTDYNDQDPAVQANGGVGTFTQGETYDVGDSPISIVAGDFNNDGLLDLATSDQDFTALSVLGTTPKGGDGGGISILLGDGDGTFTFSETILVSRAGGGATVGDFDRDGNLDIIANTSLVFGNGDGTFQTPEVDIGGAFATSFGVFDLDGDNDLDILTTSVPFDGDAIVIINNGDRTFQPPSTIATANGARNIAFGYLDGDAIPDFAALDNDQDLSIYLGDGSGGFTFKDTIDLGLGFANALNIGDLDGDQIADFVVGDFIEDMLDAFLNDGSGIGLLPPATTMGVSQEAALIADLDGNGDNDIAIASQSSGLGIALGDGSGAFGPFSFVDAGDGEFGVVAGDFNADGKLDLAVCNIDSSDVTVFLGD